MNRPINSGKRVDGVDRFSVESIRFVPLDRFQGIQSWHRPAVDASHDDVIATAAITASILLLIKVKTYQFKTRCKDDMVNSVN